MTAYTDDELFAKCYSAETGYSETSLRILLSAYDRKYKTIDSRAFFSGISMEEQNEIINDYLKFYDEIRDSDEFASKKRVGKRLLLADDIHSMESWIRNELIKKEDIHPTLDKIAYDYVKSLDHRPEIAYITGSASMKSKNPFLFIEDAGQKFFLSNLDMALVYPIVNKDIVIHCINQAKRKGFRNKMRMQIWPMTFENMGERLKNEELVYASHTFEDIEKGSRNIRLY